MVSWLRGCIVLVAVSSRRPRDLRGGALNLTRRDFLAATLCRTCRVASSVAHAASSARCRSDLSGGGRTPPFGQLLGARPRCPAVHRPVNALTDKPDTLVTPTDRFFVRAPPRRRRCRFRIWKLGVGGPAASPFDLDARALDSMMERGGRYLLECSGNVDQSNYGLMSTADWDGVPSARVLDRVRPASPVHRVLVSGVDDEAQRCAHVGARRELDLLARSDLDRALLATRMNGTPLPADHGAPLRPRSCRAGTAARASNG